VFLEFVGFYPVGGGVFLAPGGTPDLRAAEYRVGVDGVDPYVLGLSSSARQRARCSSGIALIGNLALRRVLGLPKPLEQSRRADSTR
jgi:hypothetical protein